MNCRDCNQDPCVCKKDDDIIQVKVFKDFEGDKNLEYWNLNIYDETGVFLDNVYLIKTAKNKKIMAHIYKKLTGQELDIHSIKKAE